MSLLYTRELGDLPDDKLVFLKETFEFPACLTAETSSDMMRSVQDLITGMAVASLALKAAAETCSECVKAEIQPPVSLAAGAPLCRDPSSVTIQSSPCENRIMTGSGIPSSHFWTSI
ncbi:Dnaj-like Subfamily B Member 14 [Manis pentadactyla]|nr:Dnaj-like Subfamily B Member 14 [Manis pentadactyla]